MSVCTIYRRFPWFYYFSDSGLAPDPKKVEAIGRYPTPKDLTELRRFLGMASYYRRFISGFSDIATPLNRLTQKDVPFVWDKNCETTFQTLKEQLVSSPVLAFPETDGDYILYTDASDNGVGAVLAQEDGEGRERELFHMHRKHFQVRKRTGPLQRKRRMPLFGHCNISTHMCMAERWLYIQIVKN